MDSLSRTPSRRPNDHWARARRAAREVKEASVWREALARRLAEGPGICAAGVYTCSPGYPFAHSDAIAPAHHAEWIRTFFRNKIQEIHRRDPVGIERTVALGSAAHAPLSLGGNASLTRQIRREFLAPMKAKGLLTSYCIDGKGRVLGWLCLTTRVSDERALDQYGPQLTKISEVASRTLQRAIGLASGCGLQVPANQVALPNRLSARELEIARLVSIGMSDLNIARRLAISENTVGVHLHRVFRKLGVHTRVELAALAGSLAAG